MEELVYARYMSDIAHFITKLEENPNSKYYMPIALAYNRLEKYEDTIELCRQYVETDQDNLALKSLYAEALLYAGYQEQAQELLYEVLIGDEACYKTFKMLGIISKNNNEIDDALRYFKSAYIRSPEDPDIVPWIIELGGTVDENELWEERKAVHKQPVEEDDEDEIWYREIRGRIEAVEADYAEFLANPKLTSVKNAAKDEESEEDSTTPADDVPSDEVDALQDETEEIAEDITDEVEDETLEDVDLKEEGVDDIEEASEEIVEELIEQTEDTDDTSADDLMNALMATAEEEAEQVDEDDTSSLFDTLLDASEDEQPELDENQSEFDDLASALAEGGDEIDDLASALQSDDDTDSLFDALLDASDDEQVEEQEELDDLASMLLAESGEDVDDTTSTLQADDDNTEPESLFDDLLNTSEEETQDTPEINDIDSLFDELSNEQDVDVALADIEEAVGEQELGSDIDDLFSDLPSEVEIEDNLLEGVESTGADVGSGYDNIFDDVENDIEVDDVVTESAEDISDAFNLDDSELGDFLDDLPSEPLADNVSVLEPVEQIEQTEQVETQLLSVSFDEIFSNERRLEPEEPTVFTDLQVDEIVPLSSEAEKDFIKNMDSKIADYFGDITEEDDYKFSEPTEISGELGEFAPFVQRDILDEIMDVTDSNEEPIEIEAKEKEVAKEATVKKLNALYDKIKKNKREKQ